MFFLRTPEHGLRIPSPSESLPGRAEPLPVPAVHFVSGAPLSTRNCSATRSISTAGIGMFAPKQSPGVTAALTMPSVSCAATDCMASAE